jgi:methionyl-tRNA formyltransferase
MRAAFLGTPAAAVPSLAALVDVADVEVVITRPDAQKGRRRRPTPPPVAVAAAEWGLPVVQPATAAELMATLDPLDLDFAVVVAYGRILRPELLEVTRYGFLNVHFSLLPRWRGAAPVERAILAGDAGTGVSLMQIDEGLDTGPVISVTETPIAQDETGGTLSARLSYLGAELLDEALPGYLSGQRVPAPQISAAATNAPPLTVAEAQIDGTHAVMDADRMVRAYAPRPGAWVIAAGERIKLWEVAPSVDRAPAGTIVVDSGLPVLGLADGALELRRLQPAGKRILDGADWVRGRHGVGAIVEGRA